MTIDELNELPEAGVHEALERCCGAPRWVARMSAARPFRDVDAVFAAARSAFREFDDRDWIAAFAHHPKIGDLDALREKFASTAAWAGEEQRGASGAPEATLAALAEGNRAYQEKFGYIFIVCATGRSADQMLELLRARIGNEAERERATAAEEQMRITRLRLEKLLGAPS
jgi:2-oxo-4-hydroxy-4-carboxy-5-ureidoimidazoline decarboxylase